MKNFIGAALAVGLAAITSSAQTALNLGFSNLPLRFEANRGQSETAAPFIARGTDAEFSVSPTDAQLVLRQSNGGTAAARMRFVGANPAARIYGDAEMPGKINYLAGDNPAQWQSGVPTFAKVRVEGVYPGINLVYYGNGRQLEYDFDLAPGVDPQTIAIRFDGVEKIAVNPQGELIVSLNGGKVVQHPPVVYQNDGAARRIISGGYKLLDAHTVTFAVGRYDPTRRLVIDPVLSYSTYFGGNYGNNIHALALDQDGFIYVAGETLATKITNAPSGFQTNFQGGIITGDAFVAKFDNSGTNLIYFTYIGGHADEAAYGIAVTGGNAYITGGTESPDFPTSTNALYGHIGSKILPQGFYFSDAFVAELNTNGSQLVYSTYLGGNGQDIGTAITVDTSGNAYVVGYTSSTNFPTTTNAMQRSLLCTNSLYVNANAFIAEIAPGGTNLNYCSYLGGTNNDAATAIALDRASAIYVAGYTSSTNFPIKNPLPGCQFLNGYTNPPILPYYIQYANYDAFVAKFQPGFSNLVYSTFLGGTNNDLASGIAVDAAGSAYVVGSTTSPNYPYTNIPAGFSTNLTSFVRTNLYYYYYFLATNSFLTQIKWDGTNTIFGGSLTFGGYGVDSANGVALDSSGNIFITGSATSTNFPVTPANLFGSLSPTNASANPYFQPTTSDAFVIVFSNDFSGLIYSTYLGGNGIYYYWGGGNDSGNAIAVDTAGNAYVAGQTASTNFPAFDARQAFLISTNDAFLAKIISIVPAPRLTAVGTETNLTVSWPPVGQESPAQFALESNTNLLTTNWITITTAPVWTNGAYQFQFTPTNAMGFFRLHGQ